MARLFKRGKIYYAWVPKPEGGVEKKTTQCTDERAAHARASELERIALDPDSAAASAATLRDALELLIRDRASQAKAKKRSYETVEFYRKKSGVLVDGVAAVLKRSPKAAIFLREVKASLVDDYIYLRREDGVVDSTIAKELTTWRAAMRLAKRRRLWRGELEEVFLRGFESGSEPRERWVSPDEFVRLRDAMVRPIPVRQPDLEPVKLAELRARRANGERRDELAKAFNVSISTVTRLTSPTRVDPEPGEARGHELFAIVCYSIATSAEWSAIWRARDTDIAADLTTVKVRGSKNRLRVDRDVPIQLYAFGVLLDYARQHGDGELVDEEGRRFLFRASHASNFRSVLIEACKRAGIPRLSPNDLRRTHAKWLRLVGVAPATIAPSMGHADARMVERVYGKSSAKELAGVQLAQIIHPAGLLMGGEAHKTNQNSPSPAMSERANPTGFAVPRPGIEPGTRGFSIPRDGPTTPNEMPLHPTEWAANGQLTSAARTPNANPELNGSVGSNPPSTQLSGAHETREEIVSKPLAKTSAQLEEEFHDRIARGRL